MLNTRVYLAFREMRKHFHNIFFLYLVLELNNYAKNHHNVSTYVRTCNKIQSRILNDSLQKTR